MELDRTEKNSDSVLNELVCPVCLDLYDHPVTLECGHNFCKSCINRVLDVQPDASCPQCRKRLAVRKYTTNRTLEAVTAKWRSRHSVDRGIYFRISNVNVSGDISSQALPSPVEEDLKHNVSLNEGATSVEEFPTDANTSEKNYFYEKENAEKSGSPEVKSFPEPQEAIVESNGTCHQVPRRKAVIWKRSKSFVSLEESPQGTSLTEMSDSITTTDGQEKSNLELLVHTEFAALHEILNQLHEHLHTKEQRLIENIMSGKPMAQNEVLETLYSIRTTSNAIRKAVSDSISPSLESKDAPEYHKKHRQNSLPTVAATTSVTFTE
ncbi:E3 ubiquitin-protein ligase TRIM39-like [Protopterus annectens]|uniref:E3 ubiquitin-protein ligase TRIM39-like n=1 Tax=Protopterus annectens TaxID=7888 RepID=UPI001CFA257A|nr:E3 ubiquitin-protein ligase TRIM39-like [Protopterus annectens]